MGSRHDRSGKNLLNRPKTHVVHSGDSGSKQPSDSSELTNDQQITYIQFIQKHQGDHVSEAKKKRIRGKLKVDLETAWQLLFDQYRWAFVGRANKHTSDPHVAEMNMSHIQETFIRCVLKYSADQGAPFSSYLFAALSRATRDIDTGGAIRRPKGSYSTDNEAYQRAGEVSCIFEDDLPETLDYYDGDFEEAWSDMKELLDKLPKSIEKKIFIEHHLKHKTHKQLSDKYGITLRSVKSKLELIILDLRELAQKQ